ncbi:hypothetical protein LTR28_003348 [Elasticomyces elasticus]|nr:hypothetical protein LTR28_003348 [Elasticomyces elasticus]
MTEIAAQLLGDLVEYGIKTADDGGATISGLLNPSERSQLAIDTVALLEGLIDGIAARNASVDEQEEENSANLFATLLQLLGLPRLQDSILEEKLLHRVWTVFVRSVASGFHLTEDPKHTLHTFTSILCEICALPLCFSLYVSKDATLAQVVDCLYATLKRGPPASSKESRTAACLMLGNLVRGGDLASETALAMRMLKYEKTVPPRPSCLVACLALYERTDKVATKLEVARTIVILLRALGSRARTDHASEEPRDATDAESRTSRRHLIRQLLLRVPHVLDPLFFAVQQDMPQVRSSAVFALGIVAVASQQDGAQEAPGPLLSCLLRQDEGARKAITDALAETVEAAERSDGADEVLKGDAANARAVLLSLGRLSVMSSWGELGFVTARVTGVAWM